jgi:four helix bundle protein
MRGHNQLRAFHLADDLVMEIYRITKNFPKEEMYVLTSQMRLSALSISSNIVEGCYRETSNEYCRYLEMAFSSLKENNYQFTLAVRQGYILEIESKKLEERFNETERVLAALLRANRKNL